MTTGRKLAFGLALLGATVGAGIGLAGAQTDTTTPPPTTEAPAPAPHAPDHERGDCPHMDGAQRDSATAHHSSAGFRLMRV